MFGWKAGCRKIHIIPFKKNTRLYFGGYIFIYVYVYVYILFKIWINGLERYQVQAADGEGGKEEDWL